MKTLLKIIAPASVLAGVLLTSNVSAESLNIDIGTHYNGLPDTYAAAGQAGFWNDNNLSFNNLLDINNTPTDVDLIYGSSVVNGHLGGVAIINDNFLHADNYR